MKIIKIANVINVVFDDGTILKLNSPDLELFKDIYYHMNDEEYVRNIMSPNLSKQIQRVEEYKELVNSFNGSKYLTIKDNKIYMLSVSSLTIPENLAKKILEAEQSKDKDLLTSYMNFWTLVSLNPDANVRKNLFWFLDKYEFIIAKSGLFVAYRLVVSKNTTNTAEEELVKYVSSQYLKVKAQGESPKDYVVEKHEGEYTIAKMSSCYSSKVIDTLYNLYIRLRDSDNTPTFTDQYTGKFNIKIGRVVSMDRDKCDPIQSNTCSSGLHVASKNWLTKNSCFGKVPLVVLVNPTDVVAVPPEDGYGKMRVCAYYPVSVLNSLKDEIIINSGFECDFIDKICYTGTKNTIDNDNYSLNIPEIPEINRQNITERLLVLGRSLNKVIE